MLLLVDLDRWVEAMASPVIKEIVHKKLNTFDFHFDEQCQCLEPIPELGIEKGDYLIKVS